MAEAGKGRRSAGKGPRLQVGVKAGRFRPGPLIRPKRYGRGGEGRRSPGKGPRPQVGVKAGRFRPGPL